ncbi:hypothetical protein KKD60_03225, partial [Patescibacteria group bacterium]|nr:hypothetical protein [Patescibacteria group bacterium]
FLKFVKPSVLGNGLNPATLEKEPSSKFNDLNICLAADFFSQNTPDYFSGDEYYNYAMIRMLVARDNNNCNSFSKELMENCNSFYYKLVSLKDYSDKVISNLTDDAKLIVLALVDGSADHCNLVNDQYDKKLCFAMAAGNPDMCVFDRSIAANDCIKSKQDDGGTIGCKLEAERAEKRCQSTVYLSKASKTSDKGICDMINDRFMREYCIVLNMDDDYNLKTEVNNFFHDNFCYEKYALDAVKEKKDQQLCEKIPQRDSDNKIMHEECLAIFSKD